MPRSIVSLAFLYDSEIHVLMAYFACDNIQILTGAEVTLCSYIYHIVHLKIAFKSVSYTHLTLPTIYSV